MDTLKLGAAILMIIVAVPIIVGYCWPTDSEMEPTWTTEDGSDITESLATVDIPIIDTYNGPNNNLWTYFLGGRPSYHPVSIGDSPSNIPDSAITSTVETLTSSESMDPADFSGYRLDIYPLTGYVDILKDGIPLDHQFSSIAYYPDSASIWGLEFSKMVHITVTPDMRIAYGAYASPSHPVQVIFSEYAPTGKYVDLSAGFELDSQQDVYWSNGLMNRGATIWIKNDPGTSITIGPWNQAGVTLNVNNTMITANNVLLGSSAAYPYTEIEFHADGITVKGIIGADTFLDGGYSYGNVLELGGTISSFETMAMRGTAIFEIKRTTSEIGTSKGMQDATITPYDYFPHYSWQVVLSQPAQFGDHISIGGGSYYVYDGAIHIGTDVVPIRDMAILSLLLDGVQHIYINGFEVRSESPNPDEHIVLWGDWYVNVEIYDVSQGVQEHYLWSIGSFGLDHTGYCMVGIMTALTMALAGGMYGKRSASKAAVILLISGMSAAAYFCFL